MAKFNGMIVASVNAFTKGEADKNGKNPVILNVIAGKCPNRNVLSGTVAENIGIELGKTYLMSVREGEPDATYGRQFVYSKLSELKGVEIIQTAKEVGPSSVFDVAAEHASEGVATDSGFSTMSR